MKRANYKQPNENQNKFERVTSNTLKTKNNNEMKTKNKTQKTVLKSMAVITSFILMSLTVSAQDLWQSFVEKNTANEIALAIIDNSNESQLTSNATNELTELNSAETQLENVSENTMALEEWMTNENIFKVEEDPTKKKIIKTATFVFEETKESKLEFEAWMFNPKCWKVR